MDLNIKRFSTLISIDLFGELSLFVYMVICIYVHVMVMHSYDGFPTQCSKAFALFIMTAVIGYYQFYLKDSVRHSPSMKERMIAQVKVQRHVTVCVQNVSTFSSVILPIT